MKYIKYALLITFTLLAFSCVDNPSGLFYSLQYESEIYDGTLDNGLTVGGMAKRNSYYFIGSGNVKYKAENALNWTDDNPDGLSGYTCYRIIDLDEIYAIYFNSETLVYKLFKADTSAVATGGITWSSEIEITGLGGESLIDIAVSNGRIFLYTETTVAGAAGSEKRFSVYSTNSTSLTGATAVVTELSLLSSYGELDVDWDGTDFWLISGNKLFSGASGALADVTDAALAADTNNKILGNGFGGLICDGSTVYLSTEEGVLLKYNGVSWSDLTSDAVLNRLFDFQKFTVAADSIDVILLGSELGYYELDRTAAAPAFVSPETADTILSSPVQFASIDLSNNIIRDFYADSAAGIVFSLGYNSGLWKNSLKSGERFWDLE